MRGKEKIKKMQELGIVDFDVSEVIKTDYESIVDELKEETQEETTSLIHAAQSVGMKLFI